MKMPGLSRSVAAVAAFPFVHSSAWAANDNLADRVVIQGIPAQPIAGTTAGQGVEPGEINESGLPANFA
jgi:hypothetical protein